MKYDKQIYDAIIVGAGPAGLIASITAANCGRKVLLLEKNDIPGRKLLISGQGRCNITNATEDVGDFTKNFSASGKFLKNCFHIFFNKDLMAFFEKRKVKLKVERGRRVFPESDNARDILNALIDSIKKAHIDYLLNANISDIKKSNNLFEAFSEKGTERFLSKNILIATGGISYPKTGSSGFGLHIAQKFGHTVIQAKPALVGLNCSALPIKKWQGISLKNITCTIISDGSPLVKKFGEILFTHFGISGPVTLDLSASAYDYLEQGKSMDISIDFKPALTYDKVEKRILREFEDNKNKSILQISKTLLPKKMASSFLDILNIIPSKKVHQITKAERTSLVEALKDFRFPIISTRPIEEAIVTRGGVSTKEINPKTMESRLVKGLHFAGEVIDVDAGTGGYNMQAAFSTGYVAGKNL